MSTDMPQPDSSSLVETSGDDDDYSSSSEEEEEDTKDQIIIDPAWVALFPVLAELLAINVFKTTKKPHDHYSGQMKVYGSVTVEDAAGRFILFDKDKGDSVVIPSDGSLPFGSTSRCIAGPFFALFILLKTEDEEEDLELTNGYFSMDFVWEKYHWFFNRPVGATFDGEDGYTMVNFAVFNRAVQAEIEVNLLDEENVVHEVYGQITSLIGNWKYGSGYQKKYFPTMVFDVPEDEPLKLKSGDTFPLLKSVIAVPYDSYIEVDTNLWVSGTQVSSSISLDPAVSGYRKELVNKAISVKVTWHTPQPWLTPQPRLFPHSSLDC